MTQPPQWRFREMAVGEVNVDPTEGEFFNTDAVGGIADALVRESIQNSLDAAAGDGPVRVCFSFFDRPACPDAEAADRYVGGLWPHLRARHAGLQEVPAQAEELSFVLVEDFGTRGLQGDVRQHDDLNDDPGSGRPRNDFYYFWRNIGRTQKGETDLGRWGLGKTVFQAASRINSFFGLTVRQDDGRALLMGQSVLKIHREAGKRYAPYGYFARFEDQLALPVEEAGYLDSFGRDFSLERRDQPGLSILIPYPDRELDARQCAQSVLNHYFFPLLAGRLIVEIVHAGRRDRLDAGTLSDGLRHAGRTERRDFQGLASLARWALHLPAADFVRLGAPEAGRAPKLREDLFGPEQVQAARRKFTSGGRLALHVPLRLHRIGDKEPLLTGFDVFLERDEKLDRAEDRFIRQGITIPEIGSLRHRGVRAIVSISEPRLSSFVGDAENPAHTEWERNSRRLKKRYRLGPSTLDFIKSSPREIVRILTQPVVGRDEHLLRNIFSLQSDKKGEQEQTDRPGGEGEEKKGTPGDGELEISATSGLQMGRIQGGFSLSRHPKATEVPPLITVWMAYEVRAGNPFKKYTTLDFQVNRAPISIQVEGAEVQLAERNVVQVAPLGAAFRLKVTGFDLHRDLRVRTVP